MLFRKNMILFCDMNDYDLKKQSDSVKATEEPMDEVFHLN